MKKTKKPLSIEQKLDAYSALSELEALVSAGCRRDELLDVLDLAFLTDESWENRVGMDLRTFKKSIDQIKDCANLIDRLDHSELLYHQAVELGDTRFAAIHQSPTLSERLLDYAAKIEALRRERGPKTGPAKHAWKAYLLAIVLHATGSAHDKELSALIAAALDHPSYSEVTHGAWRRAHRSIVESAVRRYRERLRRREAARLKK